MSTAWKRAVVETPLVGRLVLLAYRAKMALAYYRRPLAQLVRWLLKSNETTNYTYDLEPTNQRYLAALLSRVLDVDQADVERYFDEATNDVDLHLHIAQESRGHDQADTDAKLGRRLAWYAIVRALKPKVVIETGVDKGLGACALAAALKRNTDEGFPGRYYGTDINPAAGYLLSGVYAKFGEVLYGDSIQSLTRFDQPIDLFINDSDHSAEYEAAEYEVVAPKLANGAIVLGDNAHVTDKLLNFSVAHGRKFLFFAERPADHWYPGGGVGISYI